jgi:putative hemolysin
VNTNLLIGLLVALSIILLKTLFTASLSALINARKSVLREQAEAGSNNARRALRLGEDATPLLATQQFISIVTNVLIVMILTSTVLVQLLDDIPTAVAIAFYSVGLLLLSVALMVVDRLSIALVSPRSENFAMAMSGLSNFLIRVLSPIVRIATSISGRTATWMGGTENLHLITAEEIKTMVDAGSEEGVLDDEEKEMIYSIIRFSETLAREVMIPRIDVVALEDTASIEEALRVIIKGGHSRIPVYHETLDNIIGVLYAKDLLRVWQSQESPDSIVPLLRRANFVPEDKKASDLLFELQERKTHLVFVTDEYGGTAGLLTIEDLLEEIVGEIQDEYDTNEEAAYEQINEYEYIFNARIDLDDLNHLLDVSIPTDESDTLGGYIFTTLGRVPTSKDEIVEHGLSFKVLLVNGRRIRKVHVRKLDTDETDEKTRPDEEVPEKMRNGRSPLPSSPVADTGTN